MSAAVEQAWPGSLERLQAFALDGQALSVELIERFGRFPRRNAILNRPSRPEEIALLAAGGESLGQSPHVC